MIYFYEYLYLLAFIFKISFACFIIIKFADIVNYYTLIAPKHRIKTVISISSIIIITIFPPRSSIQVILFSLVCCFAYYYYLRVKKIHNFMLRNLEFGTRQNLSKECMLCKYCEHVFPSILSSDRNLFHLQHTISRLSKSFKDINSSFTLFEILFKPNIENEHILRFLEECEDVEFLRLIEKNEEISENIRHQINSKISIKNFDSL